MEIVLNKAGHIVEKPLKLLMLKLNSELFTIDTHSTILDIIASKQNKVFNFKL